MPARALIGALFDGPVDVVGDVHGEIGPLRQLLHVLGYDAAGGHADGRRLVFVGDLADRGPDSPAVIELVRDLVHRGVAQCVLGNHELNLLRNESKPGNRWFMDALDPEQQAGGEFEHCRVADDTMTTGWLEFFATLPLALERADLRVVHAAWMPGAINELRESGGSVVALYKRFEIATLVALEREGLLQVANDEEAQWAPLLGDRNAEVPLLTALGESDERYQMGNPVRVVTSGVERLARHAFWSSGKWRMVERVRWWDEYEDDIPVIVGHYWRQATPVTASAQAASRPGMFEGTGSTEWVGARKQVFCVDFSIGVRYQERRAGHEVFRSHLAAMRWPERELWFESGRVT